MPLQSPVDNVRKRSLRRNIEHQVRVVRNLRILFDFHPNLTGNQRLREANRPGDRIDPGGDLLTWSGGYRR
jgi:hypothetical protein